MMISNTGAPVEGATSPARYFGGVNVIRFAGAALAGLFEAGLVKLKGPAKKVAQSSEDEADRVPDAWLLAGDPEPMLAALEACR